MGLLGDLTPTRFLEEHWQKKPLLVRGAIPGFEGLLSREELARLAGRDDVSARTVRERGEPSGKQRHSRKPRWHLEEGPFPRLDLSRVPKERFTLLVGGLEAHVDGAWELLARFSFLPWGRVDDLMVSWAVPGGSVGPHFDLYDVFLLQGPGRRRWQISVSDDLEESDDEGVPVLRRFRPSDEWVLEPGDMLYLPPKVGHFGVAVDECMTYSIGFTAPTNEQLAHNFLGFLAEDLAPEGQYQDPDLTLPAHAGEVSDEMIARVSKVLDELRWDDDVIGVFLGRLLTGPKPHTPRRRPARVLDQRAFAARLSKPGALVLAKASRLLFRGSTFFLDGAALSAAGPVVDVLVSLADARCRALPVELDDEGRELLYALHRAGKLELDDNAVATAPRRSRAR